MIIDCHGHLYDPKLAARLGKGIDPLMLDVEQLLVEQREAGIDMTIISGPRMMERGVHELGMAPTDVARSYNDFVAELVQRYPGRFLGMAVAHPFMRGDMEKETERAVKELGLRGLLVNPKYGEQFLDSPEAEPFWELACDLDVPVFIHGTEGCVGEEYMREFRLVELVGRVNEITLCTARLILSGVLERHPKLKFLLARLGGAITTYAGRIDHGWECRHSRAYVPPWGRDLIPRKPSEYLKMMYVDTQTFHPPAILCAVQTMGADHVLLGSDFPPVPRSLRLTVEDVKGLPISDVDKAKILGENAMQLFKYELI